MVRAADAGATEFAAGEELGSCHHEHAAGLPPQEWRAIQRRSKADRVLRRISGTGRRRVDDRNNRGRGSGLSRESSYSDRTIQKASRRVRMGSSALLGEVVPKVLMDGRLRSNWLQLEEAAMTFIRVVFAA